MKQSILIFFPSVISLTFSVLHSQIQHNLQPGSFFFSSQRHGNIRPVYLTTTHLLRRFTKKQNKKNRRGSSQTLTFSRINRLDQILQNETSQVHIKQPEPASSIPCCHVNNDKMMVWSQCALWARVSARTNRTWVWLASLLQQQQYIENQQVKTWK